MLESILSPGNGDSDRIGNPDKLLIVGTDRELNAGASSEVERWNYDHPARIAIRARIMRREGVAFIAC